MTNVMAVRRASSPPWYSSPAPPSRSGPVDEPDVGLPVLTRVAAPVDVHGSQALREHVVASLRKTHPGPGLPVRHAAGDAHRTGENRAQPRPEPCVHPDPRVEP